MKDRREVDDINSPDAELGGRRNPLESNGGGGGYGYVFSVYDYGYALNSLATGNYSSIDEFMYAQFSSGNGRYVPLNGVAGEGVSVMIGDVSCYGRYSYSSSGSGFSSSDYSFTMKSQGDFHTCSGRTRGGGGSGGSGNTNGVDNVIGAAGWVNNVINSAASGVTGGKAFPNAKVGSNGKLYLSGKFHGNQYVKVLSLKSIAKKTLALGVILSIGEVFVSRMSEGDWGPQTQSEAVGAVGGIAGGIAGTWVGCEIGAFFWGVGAVPGAVIGFIGGCVGSYGGAWGAQNAYNNYIKE